MQYGILFLVDNRVLCLVEGFKVAFAMKSLLPTGTDFFLRVIIYRISLLKGVWNITLASICTMSPSEVT